VRRDKASLFQWVQGPLGDRSSRKQPGQAWRQADVEVEELLLRGHPDVVDADLADYLEAASYCPPVYEVTSNSVG
jgi:hypothetical protein